MNTRTCFCIKNTLIILLLAPVIYFNIKQTRVIEFPPNKTEETLHHSLKPSRRIDDKYHQQTDLKNEQFATNSQRTCEECSKEFLLVIAVHSSLSNIEQRAAIRETWGKQTDCIKVLYFVGTSTDSNITQRVQDESLKHHDIIQGNFIDTYRNLTYKHVMVLKWATHYCQQAKYIVRTDDDVMVNVDVLYKHLKKDYWGTTRLIACLVKYSYNSVVVRKHCKWSATKEEYPEDKYPDYCKGSFIIYSADVVRRLLQESSKAPYFWIDDIHITGTLAKRIGVKHTNLIKNWTLPTSDELFSRGPKHVNSFIYGPVNLKPDDMRRVWKGISILIRANYTMIELLRKFNKSSPVL